MANRLSSFDESLRSPAPDDKDFPEIPEEIHRNPKPELPNSRIKRNPRPASKTPKLREPSSLSARYSDLRRDSPSEPADESSSHSTRGRLDRKPTNKIESAPRAVDLNESALNRYTPVDPHQLRDSPLFRQPDGLPSFEQWKKPRPARDCALCGELHLTGDLPSLTNCNHHPKVCRDCYCVWLESELNSKGWRQIKCPEVGCKEFLNHAEMQQYASPEVFARFDALSILDSVQDNRNIRWCRNPDCKSGQKIEPDACSHLSRCIACGFESYTFLGEGPHEGETSREFDLRTRIENEKSQTASEASASAISQGVKKCPGQNCGWNVEKLEGDDHMTCSKCRHEFCWNCLAGYQAIRNKGSSEHATNCAHHPNQRHAIDDGAVANRKAPAEAEVQDTANKASTKIQPSTLKVWKETLGNQPSESPQRRSTRKKGGFPCLHSGCGRAFDRLRDLQ
ncbi:hypothetical protein BU16DRAFT_513666 [Lophium mytilinum]|uniref:RBR-type E3 ubiquitin transferase n=1 Tax=Lophium mytilinum TaxID=390894 RepID=A0A6A6QML5_9PEZI|nr:hypothetical protein BU16DRAFT_513666 [Lophium mytilinum]